MKLLAIAYTTVWLLGFTDADAAALAAVLTPVGLVGVAWIQVRSARDIKAVKQTSSDVQEKVSETHTQVTVNGHKSDRPTVLDKLEDLAREVREVRRRLDRHMDWHFDVPDEGDPR